MTETIWNKDIQSVLIRTKHLLSNSRSGHNRLGNKFIT